MSNKKKQMIVLCVLLLGLGGYHIRGMVSTVQSGQLATHDKSPSPSMSPQPGADTGQGAITSDIHWERPDLIPDDLPDPMHLKSLGARDSKDLPEELTAATDNMSQQSGDVTIQDVEQGGAIQLDGSIPPIYLKGIIYARDSRSSIITDVGIFYESEEIHGAKVVRIERRAVEFNVNDRTIIVRVGQSSTENDEGVQDEASQEN